MDGAFPPRVERSLSRREAERAGRSVTATLPVAARTWLEHSCSWRLASSLSTPDEATPRAKATDPPQWGSLTAPQRRRGSDDVPEALQRKAAATAAQEKRQRMGPHCPWRVTRPRR